MSAGAITRIAAHLAILLLLPPLLGGVIVKTKALLVGRRGPSLLQPYYDLSKLLRKQAAASAATTVLFALAPAVIVVTALGAGLLVPLGPMPAPVAFAGDFVVFAYLLVPRYEWRAVNDEGSVSVIVYDRWTGRMQRAVYDNSGALNVMGVYTPF